MMFERLEYLERLAQFLLLGLKALQLRLGRAQFVVLQSIEQIHSKANASSDSPQY